MREMQARTHTHRSIGIKVYTSTQIHEGTSNVVLISQLQVVMNVLDLETCECPCNKVSKAQVKIDDIM